MINICEDFGMKNNLKFSTDPNPAKSKTKCMYMCGPKVKTPVYPVPLQLSDRELPWVTHATHLGHELHQECTMDMDIWMKRAIFIKNSTDIRDLFSFALPTNVLSCIQTYNCHFYGSQLWDLYGNLSNQLYRSWNTTVKLVWGIPRSTHNYFLEHLVAKDFRSARQQILSKYVGFLKRLRNSVSDEVRIMCYIAAQDIMSVTAKNCYKLEEEFSLDPWLTTASRFSIGYKLYDIPELDRWRLSYLMDLLRQKYDMFVVKTQM